MQCEDEEGERERVCAIKYAERVEFCYFAGGDECSWFIIEAIFGCTQFPIMHQGAFSVN